MKTHYLLQFSILSERVFPAGSNLTLNIGFTTIMQSLSEIALLDTKDIQNIASKTWRYRCNSRICSI